jgi:hypothetical protein
MTLRMAVMGEQEATKRPATNEELQKMKALLTEGLVAGSLGLSTGLSLFIYDYLFIYLLSCLKVRGFLQHDCKGFYNYDQSTREIFLLCAYML